MNSAIQKVKLIKERIVFVSDHSKGGAAIACGRLVRGLRHCGQSARWVVLRGDESCGAEVASAWPSLSSELLHRMVVAGARSERLRRWTSEQCGNATVLSCIQKTQCDLISLHGIHEGLSFRLPERLPRNIPLVWTLHDMWPITGYCYHSFECRKYLAGCAGECPQLGRWGVALSEPRREWLRRESYFRTMEDRIAFVSPSRWLEGCARRRVPQNVRVEHIPNGLDLNKFKPLSSRKFARHVLGLPQDKPVIMTGAYSLGSRVKGSEILAKALSHLVAAGDEFVVAAFGHLPGAGSQVEYHLGFVQDEMMLNLCYNAADVFVHPSRADNLPNTLIECLAAGTPAITTDVGGCPEIVEHGKTGFLAKAGDAHDLAKWIHEFLSLSPTARDQMGANCRETAMRLFSVELMADRYSRLFEEMMASPGIVRAHG